ncbi:MAG: hypothetical protein ABI851_01050 [Saprospiraceae bacterium]
MRIKIAICFLTSTLIVFQSCTNDSGQSIEVCFQTEVLPIFVSTCTYSGCHNTFDNAKNLDLSNYEGILKSIQPGNHRASDSYKVLISLNSPMPPSPYDRLTEDKLLTIASWIDQGANNNACQSVNCDTSNISLSGQVKPILDKYCGGCHSIKTPQGNIDFRTYSSLKKYVDNGSLVGSINFDQSFSNMPKNSNKMPACDINIIAKWVNDGAPNN